MSDLSLAMMFLFGVWVILHYGGRAGGRFA